MRFARGSRVGGALLTGVFALGLVGGAVPDRPSTIEAALGLPWLDEPALAARRAFAVAEGTSRCMNERGFRYQALPEPAPTVPDADLPPLEWAARWGFGVSTAVGSAMDDPVGAEWPAMSAREREAFAAALYGQPARAGCAPAASAEVFGLRDRALAPLRADLVALADRVDADPRTAVARRAWRTCIGAIAGAPSLDGRGRAAYAGWILGWFRDRTAAASGHSGPLRLIQADERRIAVAAVRCELAFDRARAEIRGPYERALVDRFRAALRTLGHAIREIESAYPASAAPSVERTATESQ